MTAAHRAPAAPAPGRPLRSPHRPCRAVQPDAARATASACWCARRVSGQLRSPPPLSARAPARPAPSRPPTIFAVLASLQLRLAAPRPSPDSSPSAPPREFSLRRGHHPPRARPLSMGHCHTLTIVMKGGPLPSQPTNRSSAGQRSSPRTALSPRRSSTASCTTPRSPSSKAPVTGPKTSSTPIQSPDDGRHPESDADELRRGTDPRKGSRLPR
jgi:hypothetical protein